jgi:hypothetical protein
MAETTSERGRRSSRVDDNIERISRWTAARLTRRSFFHRAGQVAMMVAAGPVVANILARQADARVCGQSGVTPKCDTFDCIGVDDVWGWCWYASDGCCANDGLKKICDCCTVNYPNVHGYCPSGTNVRCIVESCGQDPRVLSVELGPVAWDPTSGYHHAAILAGHASARTMVVAPAGDTWAQLIAAPLAGTLGVPLLPVAAAGLSSADTEVLDRLGTIRVLTVGALSAEATASLSALTVDLISTAAEPGPMSVEVANYIRTINDVNRTVTVATSGLSAEAAPLAANLAALNGYPLVVGTTAAEALDMPTLYVGPEPADAGVPSERTSSTDMQTLSIELADLASAAPFVPADRVTIAPIGTPDIIGLLNLATPLVLHPPNALGPVAKWFETHSLRYGLLSGVYFTTGPGELTTEQYWTLQGMVNGFRVDQLQGVSGEGLPVIRQPWAERPIGLAKVDGSLDFGSEGAPGYWTSAGQTFRS